MADKYVFTREFWNLNHPKVAALASGTMTEEKFVKSITPKDPFLVMKDNRERDLYIVIGYPAAEVVRRDKAMKDQINRTTTGSGNMPNSTADTDRELILANFPETAEIYAKIDDTGCKECKGGLKTQIVVKMFESCKKNPRPDLADKFKTKLTPAASKLLAGETIEPNPDQATPFSQMAKVGTVKRPVLFSCPIVCGGNNGEICGKCRSDVAFRKEMVKHFDVPPAYQVKKGDESYVVSTIPSPSQTYEFACPYRSEVDNKFPSVFKMSVNAVSATIRVMRAVIGGKDVTVQREEAVKRENACRECPKHDPRANRCFECGCFLDYKIPLTTEKCPLGKW